MVAMAPASGENMPPTVAKRQTRVYQQRNGLKEKIDVRVLVALEDTQKRSGASAVGLRREECGASTARQAAAGRGAGAGRCAAEVVRGYGRLRVISRHALSAHRISRAERRER